MITLSIVIVNWNTRNMLRECIESLGNAEIPADLRLTEVVIVDNASSDQSAEDLPPIALPLSVVRNHENRGFAVACNQGAAHCNSDLLLFLNPDTRLFENSLSVPVHYIRDPANVNVGIVSIQLVDEAGVVTRCCARFPQAHHFAAQCVGLNRFFPATGQSMQEWDHRDTREVDQVIGAYFLVKREAFDSLGGFDERFFVYYEEVDFALRAREAGWSSVFLADAQVYHAGGGSSGQIKGRRLFYSLRSRLQYGRKHFRAGQRAALLLVTWLFEPVSRSILLLLSGRASELKHLFEGYRLLAADSLRAISQPDPGNQ